MLGISKIASATALRTMSEQGIVERQPGKQSEKVFMITEEPRNIPTTVLNPLLLAS